MDDPGDPVLYQPKAEWRAITEALGPLVKPGFGRPWNVLMWDPQWWSLVATAVEGLDEGPLKSRWAEVLSGQRSVRSLAPEELTALGAEASRIRRGLSQ